MKLKFIMAAAFCATFFALAWGLVHYRDAYKAECAVTTTYKIKEARDRLELTKRGAEQKEIRKEISNAKSVLAASGD